MISRLGAALRGVYETQSILGLILIAFLIRVFLVPFSYDVYNFWAFRVFSSFLLEGFNPWRIGYLEAALANINPWGYPPPYLLLVILAQSVSAANEYLFLYAMKMPLILSDIFAGFYLFKTAESSYGIDTARKIAALFLFNPLSVVISSVWGINDSIPIMFTVISLYLFQVRKKRWSSALFLGLGAAFKLYPFFIAPAFLANIKRIRTIVVFSVITSIPLLIVSLPFVVWDANSYLSTLLFFSTGKAVSSLAFIPQESMWWGLQVFLSHILGIKGVSMAIPSRLSSIILVSCALSLFLLLRRRNASLFVGITLYFLALYSFSFRMWDNYYSWLVPFACLMYYDESLRTVRASGRARALYVRVSNRLLTFLHNGLSRPPKPLLLLFVPVLVHVLLYNGMQIEFEGATGVFYWTLHWLGLRIIAYKLVPHYFALNLVLVASIFIVCLYYLIKMSALLVLSPKRNEEPSRMPIQKARSKPLATIFVAKGRALIVLLLVINALSFAFVSAELNSTFNHIDFRDYDAKIKIDPISSQFSFSDSFSSPLLNPQWIFGGNWNYSVHPQDSPPHVTLNANESGATAFLYRNFSFASRGLAEITFSFERLCKNSSSFSVADFNGGQLIVIADKFNYFDYNEHVVIELGSVDRSWHNFTIEFNPSRYSVIFDNKAAKSFETKAVFSYLRLGSYEPYDVFGGVCSFSNVKVVAEDFPVGAHSQTLAYSAVLAPVITILAISVILYRKETR
jgi:hypothetical protein